MKADLTRRTFDRRKHFSEVLFQQGRVQLDADLNEAQEILADVARTTGRDTIGWAGVPKYGGGFEIGVTRDGDDLTISPGRIYVDGILCVAEPVVAGRRIEPSPGEDERRRKTRASPTYRHQPDQFEVPKLRDGTHLVYLDVWERLVTHLDDPSIREKGLGGPDTAARAKVVWQVKLEAVAGGAECTQFGPGWMPEWSRTDGTLNVRTAPVSDEKNPCLLPHESGYRNLENQLYRVEIHRGGKVGEDDVTFKWSRDNGSVVTAIRHITGATLAVSGTGPDDVRGFSDNQWAEIVNDLTEAGQEEGELVEIKTVDRTTDTIVLKSTPTTAFDPARRYTLRRWDGEGASSAEVPATNGGWIPVEGGIEIRFAAGSTYRSGDYWLIPARTAAGSETGSLEWTEAGTGGTQAQRPHGVRHHFAPLAIVSVQRGQFQAPPISDCRKPFPPLIEVGEGRGRGRGAPCCTFQVGDGTSTHGDFDDIQEALDHLPEDGGTLCLLPGDHRANAEIKRDNVTIRGCGLRTKVSPQPSRPRDPVFKVVASSHVTVHGVCVASLEGVAIALDAKGTHSLRDIEVSECDLIGYRAAIHVHEGREVAIRGNRIRVLDRRSGGVAVYLAAADAVIEGNDIGLTRTIEESPEVEVPEDNGGKRRFNPHDDCADFTRVYADRRSHAVLVDRMLTTARAADLAAMLLAPLRSGARGGIQVAAGSERIRIRNNGIQGGTGNGITLGGWAPLQEVTAAPAVPEKPEVSIDHAGGLFYAVTRKDETPVPGAVVQLTSRDTRQTFTAITDQAGAVRVSNLPRGQYAVAALSPGIDVAEIRQDARVRDPLVLVKPAAKPDADTSKELAFVRQVLIEDNRIYQMGLSGIGTFQPAATQAASHTELKARRNPALEVLRLLGTPVLNLTIARNHVAGCLRATAEELAALPQGRGFGGISVGACEDLDIVENTIEHNGLAPLPVTGVFVGYGEHVEFALNRIQQNGAIPTASRLPWLPGVRGGIFVLLGSCLFDPEAAERREQSTSLAQYAVRIHGNTVSQPIGRALALSALGPVAVQDNYFDSHACPSGFADEAGGAVCVVNLGRPTRAGSIPAGTVLFSGNQTQVGVQHPSFLPHAVFSTDDVSFEGNQLRSGQGTRSPVLNALVWAHTARVGRNRFQEPALAAGVSLVSWADHMNSTDGNQGDHCIFAFCADSARLAAPNNLTLATSCEALGKGVHVAALRLARGEAAAAAGPAGTTADWAGAILDRLAAVRREDFEPLAATREIQAGYRVLLEHETQRLEMVHGAEDARVLQMRMRLERNLALVEGVEAEDQLRRVQPRVSGEKEALLHGRVTDERSRGLAGYTVALTDQAGAALGVAEATVDDTGYFGVLVTEGQATRLAQQKTPLYLTIKDRNGDVCERRPVSGAPTVGTQVAETITLAAARRSRVVTPAAPTRRTKKGGTRTK